MKTKQVIVLRKDLGMRKGKMAAQAAHASMKVFFDRASFADNEMLILLDDAMEDWSKGSFAKIVVGVESEEDLLDIYDQAKASNLPCALIKDAGRTEFNGVPTHTAVAVGPAEVGNIDPITGDLKLL